MSTRTSTWCVRVGTAETDGRELVADLYVRADAPGVPRHIHPTVAETVTVIRGKVSAWSPDEGERTLGPGETLHVPAEHHARVAPGGRRGCPHAGRGPPRGEVRGDVAPIHGPTAGRQGRTRGTGLPADHDACHEFSDVMAVAGPPLFVQRAVAALVTPVGRLRGYKGRYEEYLTRGPSEMVELGPLPV